MRCHRVLRATGVIGFLLFLYLGAQAPALAKRHNPRPKIGHAQQAANPATETGISRSSAQSAKALGRALPRITPWHKLTVKSGDTLSRLFAELDLGSAQWTAVLALKGKTSALLHLHPGDVLRIRKTPNGKLAELRFRLTKLDVLDVRRNRNGLYAVVRPRSADIRQVQASGVVRRSLPAALAMAGVPSVVANQLARIYRFRHHLTRNIQPRDAFSIIYDVIGGKNHQSIGPIVAASITTGGRNYKAFRAYGPNGDPGYYDADGHSYQPGISRHPVAYTRISSPFSRHRMDPVLHIVRPHYGVDMAAPTGTPVHAAANGTVAFAGRMHGYGRIVELKDFDGYSTRYAHMHGFAKGLHDGEHVHKGQVIGYVGETGEATGPHLHFEIRKNGVAHDPLTMKLPSGQPLPASRMAAYTARIQPLIAALGPAPYTLLAAALSPQAADPSCTRSIAFNARFALDPAGAARGGTLQNFFCVVGHPNSHDQANSPRLASSG